MGRAARFKTQRGKGRKWSTVNPWTGRRDTFLTHLSNEALNEWEADRTELMALGYADRPPEIDTPTSRGWRMPPRTPNPLELGGPALGCDPTARMLGMWFCRAGDLILKASLGRRLDGQVVVGLIVGRVFAPDFLVVTDIESLEDAAKKVRDLAEAMGLPEPEFVSMEQVMADLAAEKDGGLAAA